MKLNDATDSEISKLALSSIKELDLSGSPSISAVGLQYLIGSPVEKLVLAACLQIDDGALEVISKMPVLRSLNLDCCNDITDGGIDSLSKCPTLRDLSIRWCYDLTDAACVILARIDLSSLCMEGCELITDVGVKSLSDSTSLQQLELPSLSNITDEGLKSIAQGAIPLESLWLGRLSAITDSGVIALGNSKRLKSLSLVSIHGINKSSFEKLKKSLPALVLEINESPAPLQGPNF